MAYALALKAASGELEAGPVILIDTLIYAFISILVVGSTLNPVLRRMDVRRKPGLDEDADEEDSEGEGRGGCCQRFKERVRNFDNAFFSPLFIK